MNRRPEKIAQDLHLATVALAGKLLNPASGREFAQARATAHELHNAALNTERELLTLLKRSAEV